jgi:hypothetical protein
MVESLELGEVPFYWRIKKTAIQPPHDIPTRLPFAFSFMEDLQLVIQKRNPVVLQWLERVYKEDANVGYLQEGHALAESYGGEFIEFFRRASSLLPTPPNSAADIGCGGVYLLQKVREQGLKVKGIDPSPVTAAAGRNAGIEIVSDFAVSLRRSRACGGPGRFLAGAPCEPFFAWRTDFCSPGLLAAHRAGRCIHAPA